MCVHLSVLMVDAAGFLISILFKWCYVVMLAEGRLVLFVE